jgi:15-cis-phytoene synthase
LRTAAQLISLDHAYRRAATETAKGSKSFYFATRFFPPDLARSAHAVYWFCRHTDDLADECLTPEQGRRDIDHWAESLALAYKTGVADHPVLAVFLDTVLNHNVPIEYAHELIEGMRMDLRSSWFETFADLRLFCYRAASVVGLMMCSLIGFEQAADRERALAHAVDLGIAMQLTNILRDIGEDLGRGRIYLPRDEMARFGYSEHSLLEHRRDDSFRELMKFQIGRARGYYEAGNLGIPMLNRRGRFAVEVASDVYKEILVKMESFDYDVFERRAVVPNTKKYWLTARKMSVPVARHLAARITSLERHNS